MAGKNKIFLGILNERAGYCDGGLSIGLYDGDDKEAAKKKMVNALVKHVGIFDSKYREKIESSVTMLGLNEAPERIVTHHSTYDDR